MSLQTRRRLLKPLKFVYNLKDEQNALYEGAVMEIGVVILSNSDNAESLFKELLEIAVADIYTPWKWENYMPYQTKAHLKLNSE